MQIFVGALDRHAAHRNIATEMFPPFGEDDTEGAARDFCIVEKQFIKITHPIKQQAIGIRRFELDILLHHRRDAPAAVARRRLGLLQANWTRQRHERKPTPTVTAAGSEEPVFPRPCQAATGVADRLPPSAPTISGGSPGERDARDRLKVAVEQLLLPFLGEIDAVEDTQGFAMYIVPFSGSNGQSEANTILSKS